MVPMPKREVGAWVTRDFLVTQGEIQAILDALSNGEQVAEVRAGSEVGGNLQCPRPGPCMSTSADPSSGRW